MHGLGVTPFDVPSQHVTQHKPKLIPASRIIISHIWVSTPPRYPLTGTLAWQTRNLTNSCGEVSPLEFEFGPDGSRGRGGRQTKATRSKKKAQGLIEHASVWNIRHLVLYGRIWGCRVHYQTTDQEGGPCRATALVQGRTLMITRSMRPQKQGQAFLRLNTSSSKTRLRPIFLLLPDQLQSLQDKSHMRLGAGTECEALTPVSLWKHERTCACCMCAAG
jgi:hypothetical protein